MRESYDVIIIGGGNAGFGVSSMAHEAGKSIAFIEARDFGGTCPNRGCTPKKVLVAAAHAMHEIEQAPIHGIEVSKPKLNWAKLIEREKNLVGFIPEAMQGLAEKRGDVFRGTARFVGPNEVEVDGQIIHGKDIVIATGSKPRPLPIPGSEHMITSDEVLSDATLPKEVVFIGGGVIAMEFSHIYARAGVQVTILEALPQLLPRMDSDAVSALQVETERLGVAVKTGVSVTAIEKTADGLRVEFEHDGRNQSLLAERVVNGAGRVANIDGLNLDAAGVGHDGLRILIDDTMRSTSNSSVWVAGDAVTSSAQLSPIATYEGQIVGHNIVHGPTKRPDYSVIPSAVYTVPALSTVGLTEAEAREKVLDVSVTVSDMSAWFSTKTYAETAAWSKVLVDKSSDQVLGAHILGHHGDELIHLFAMAIRHGISASDLKSSLYAFPTFAADMKSLI
ncbi:NAD(P)/FAD-dependent oxidoreductase [Ruegeria sp. R13_0]|uniref:dihydrolipoyl dehydrogenase family protein n=1 Tax=Ruegeria sp. R13_0 TaxID=2821099 RepID=UPI001ADB4328|nr:NAD(P)/FAD-dependent oxidoreductase [Ruegeria sp. R13_0]MBO9436650.1 NAD(P)/FAD-dependent oxidoreductase [Ruegeria sp. R13_0]